MKKMIFINQNAIIRKRSGNKTIEGGLSRNSAWERYADSLPYCRDVNLSTGKTHILTVFKELFTAKDSIIFSLYPSTGVPMFTDSPAKKLIRSAYFRLINRAAKRNTVIYDISDLGYEQAIDLKLDRFPLSVLEEAQNLLFSLDASFIFASHEMREYAVRKYNLDYEKTDVCVNGGTTATGDAASQTDFRHDPSVISYVYAGTLNKGRSIEEMIDTFPDDERFRLILMGKDGEWIEKRSNNKNIIYLGPKPEPVAAYISSQCDVGLIPYDEKLLYYNIAYPTKLSFYAVVGIPYLSTPVKEVMRADPGSSLGWYASLSEWGELIKSLDFASIEAKKKNVCEHSSEFLWSETLKNKFFG